MIIIYCKLLQLTDEIDNKIHKRGWILFFHSWVGPFQSSKINYYIYSSWRILILVFHQTHSMRVWDFHLFLKIENLKADLISFLPNSHFLYFLNRLPFPIFTPPPASSNWPRWSTAAWCHCSCVCSWIRGISCMGWCWRGWSTTSSPSKIPH